MDEAGYDLTDEEDYQAGMKIKTATLKRRLKETIGLTIEEENQLKIICIAADPKGKGLAHWFEKMDNYKRRSRIETLRNEVNQIIQLKDKDDLKSAVDFAVLQDIMMGVSKQITITNQALREPLDKCKEITKDMKNDCQILKPIRRYIWIFRTFAETSTPSTTSWFNCSQSAWNARGRWRWPSSRPAGPYGTTPGSGPYSTA
jgi:ribosomal protein S20